MCGALSLPEHRESGNAGCEAELLSGSYTGVQLSDALLSGSAYGNQLTFRLSKYDDVNQVTNYVDYVVTLKRTLSLRGHDGLSGRRITCRSIAATA